MYMLTPIHISVRIQMDMHMLRKKTRMNCHRFRIHLNKGRSCPFSFSLKYYALLLYTLDPVWYPYETV